MWPGRPALRWGRWSPRRLTSPLPTSAFSFVDGGSWGIYKGSVDYKKEGCLLRTPRLETSLLEQAGGRAGVAGTSSGPKATVLQALERKNPPAGLGAPSQGRRCRGGCCARPAPQKPFRNALSPRDLCWLRLVPQGIDSLVPTPSSPVRATVGKQHGGPAAAPPLQAPGVGKGGSGQRPGPATCEPRRGRGGGDRGEELAGAAGWR